MKRRRPAPDVRGRVDRAPWRSVPPLPRTRQKEVIGSRGLIGPILIGWMESCGFIYHSDGMPDECTVNRRLIRGLWLHLETLHLESARGRLRGTTSLIEIQGALHEAR